MLEKTESWTREYDLEMNRADPDASTPGDFHYVPIEESKPTRKLTMYSITGKKIREKKVTAKISNGRRSRRHAK